MKNSSMDHLKVPLGQSLLLSWIKYLLIYIPPAEDSLFFQHEYIVLQRASTSFEFVAIIF